ncbi:MAG: hypothetical protein HFI36_05750 [Bacilli bacterium]|jgi:hypothetical protein|nr:hypothetical protein [Bacilli bacterium]MCX4254579.1 hypothetical protein [Bacilli bacterium]
MQNKRMLMSIGGIISIILILGLSSIFNKEPKSDFMENIINQMKSSTSLEIYELDTSIKEEKYSLKSTIKKKEEINKFRNIITSGFILDEETKQVITPRYKLVFLDNKSKQILEITFFPSLKVKIDNTIYEISNIDFETLEDIIKNS